MKSEKDSKSSPKKSSVQAKKRPLKKRGPYKPRKSPQSKPSPMVEKLRAKIQETKEAIHGSISSNSPAPATNPEPIPQDSALEKLRKEKEKADYADREKVRKSKQTKKRGRPTARPAPTKEGVLALLRLPFQVGSAITGYAADPIHPSIEEPLAESALAVLNDFGFEAFQKWINLGVFGALYGTCGLGWFKGLQDWTEEQRRAALAAKKDKIHDIPPAPPADAAKAV